MKVFRNAVLAGAAAIALAGVTGVATARSRYHVETVRLPDGAIEHIRYTGDQPPVVRVEAPAIADLAPLPDLLDFGVPFAQLEQMSAAMDRQAAVMLQQANTLERRLANGQAGDWMIVDLKHLPAGAEGFSTVSTFSGNHVCRRSLRYFSAGPGKAPRVETRTSGDCTAGSGHHAFHAAVPIPRPDPGNAHSHTITVDYPHPGQHPAGPARLLRVSYP